MASPMLKEKQQPANGTPHKLAGGIYAAPTAIGRGARPPPQVRAATRQRAAPHVGGGVPDAPETFCCRPSLEPPRAGHARPLPRGGGKAPCRPQTPAEGSRPLPTNRPINECPHPAASSRGYPSTGGHPRRGRRPRRPGNLLPPPIPGKTSGPGMPGPYRAAVGKPHAVHKRPRRGQDPSPTDRPINEVPTPTARRWASPMPSVNAHGGVKTPPYEPPHQRVPRPPAARRCGNGDKKTEAIPFPGTASVLYISA